MTSDSNSDVRLSAPWAEFFDELDSLLPEPIELHCIGGFVTTVLYGVPRVTADVDYVAVLPLIDLETIAGRGSPLAQKHKIYLQYVSFIAMPEDYEYRGLIECERMSEAMTSLKNFDESTGEDD